MIRSMTGFGRAEGSAEGYAITVEIKSVNHRHLDVALRLPTALSSLDLDARRLVQARVERGRVDVTAQLGPAAGRAAQEVRVDAALARRYVEQARTLGRDLGLDDDPTLVWMLDQPGVEQVAEQTPVEAETRCPRLDHGPTRRSTRRASSPRSRYGRRRPTSPRSWPGCARTSKTWARSSTRAARWGARSTSSSRS